MLAFQLVTLPVEFNASKRALNELEKQKLINNEEKKQTKKISARGTQADIPIAI